MSAVLGRIAEARPGQIDRREQILDAAEACFVRNGFHRTTMIDLAREAAISPGNFYRYFASKEAIVLALVERERGRGGALVERLEREGDRRAMLRAVIAQYFVEIPRATAILRIDIWSEATRNPAIAAMTERTEAETRAWFEGMLAGLAPGCDAAGLYALLDPLMKGIIAARALLPDYDPAPAVAHLYALIDAGLAGRLPARNPEPEPVR